MSEPSARTNESFEAFYERYHRMVYRVCYTYMKNHHDAEDCTEDVFVKVYTGDFSFHDEAHEKAWLTVTAINLCKDRLKHWWRRSVSAIEDSPEPFDDGGIGTDETLQAVLKLPEKYKDVVYLFYYVGYQTDEIAKMLHRPPSTVRNHLREARERLRKVLGEELL